MLQTRLWMGTILVILTAGMLVVDRWMAPWYPFLFLVVAGLAVGGCIELVGLLDASHRPRRLFCIAGLVLLLSVNWNVHARLVTISPGDVWQDLLCVFVALVAAAFVVEMAMYRGTPGVVLRIALTLLIFVYLGLLPSFLAQLRWLGTGDFGVMAVALTIFVPKCCDIGAYLTGRAIGKHKMTPVLSPKKTWEGAAGGLALAVVVSIGLDRLGPASPLGRSWAAEIAFGLVLGVVGMFGDLAESLIKRDSGQKDASHAVPGFGGVLDVVDSIVFTAPLTYLWCVIG